MMRKRLIILFPFTIFFLSSVGQTNSLCPPYKRCDGLVKNVSPCYQNKNSKYSQPGNWGFIRNIPDDLWQITRYSFKRKKLPGLAVVVGSSALLIWQDQQIANGVKQFAKNLHLRPETDYNVLVKVGNTKILKIPENINTALYQVGEGATGMFIAGGLYIFGRIKHDNRALQTASDLTETFISMGLVTQIIKRSTGRQSPFMATKPGGAWHLFPSFSEYQANTSGYDAFPSGHLASMMATVIVLAENYPEKKWIKPLGYSLMGLSCFAMINTDVHWMGDYPLALALGYVSGKVTTHRHKKKIMLNPVF